MGNIYVTATNAMLATSITARPENVGSTDFVVFVYCVIHVYVYIYIIFIIYTYSSCMDAKFFDTYLPCFSEALLFVKRNGLIKRSNEDSLKTNGCYILLPSRPLVVVNGVI